MASKYFIQHCANLNQNSNFFLSGNWFSVDTFISPLIRCAFSLPTATRVLKNLQWMSDKCSGGGIVYLCVVFCLKTFS